MAICQIPGPIWRTQPSGLQRLLETATAQGWAVYGPKPVEGTTRWGPISTIADLPQGWRDAQSPGRHRMTRKGGSRLFGVQHGAESAKQFLFPSRTPVWRAKRVGASLQLEPDAAEAPRIALLGLRPCDIRAIAIQDKVFLEGPWKDEDYRRRRDSTLLVAVNCTSSQPTCFCRSVGGSTVCQSGADIVLTELEGPGHFLLVQAITPAGLALVEACKFDEAAPEDTERAERECREAEDSQAKGIRVPGLKEAMVQNPEHPRYAQTAARCFACASCTQVCPTCFCSSPFDSSSLDGMGFRRERIWDSCFSEEFSYIHGGAVRRSISSRYRQWLTHKLANWQDQFGVLGCVGCGRCIAWCPAGIDIRDEAEAIRQSPLASASTEELW